MYGGDDINAVVLDIGSLWTKAGYAGEDIPKAVFHTAVGAIDNDPTADTDMNGTTTTPPRITSNTILNDPPQADQPPHLPYDTRQPHGHRRTVDGKTYYYGRAQLTERPHTNIIHPLHNGIITDWNAIECNIDYCFNTHMLTQLSEHPLLLCEPVYTPSSQRERLLELLFDRFNTPAIFFGKQPVLSTFAAGRASALVLSMSHEMTTAVPVNDGYVLHKGIRRTRMAGHMLDTICDKLIPPLHDKPLYTPKQKGVTPSFVEYKRYEIIRDIKESCCKLTEHIFDANSNIKLPAQQYTLPDGQTIDVGNERFVVGEQLFRPSQQYFANGDVDNNYTFTGLHRMVSTSIDSSDADLRRNLYENIVLSGGTTLLPGMAARLQREISNNIGPLYKVKILTGNSVSDRRYSDWLGGSILASLGSFHQMWISKQEYSEYGNQIIHKKCP